MTMTRTIVAALMAASSILPSIASAQDGQRQGREQAQERGGRGDRGQDRAQRGGQDRAQIQRPDRGQQNGAQRPDRPDRPDRQQDRNVRPDRNPQGRDQRNPDRRAGWQQRGGDANRAGFDNRGRDDRGNQGRVQGNGGYDRDRRGNDRGNWNVRNGQAQRWSNDWRRDGRYDWNRYRATNRNAFRLPRYYAPGGWNYGYRRFSIGARIATSLFGRDYWISDPWAYRLPAAYGPYRWVRYYNDAVLVDLRTGAVIDTAYGIFW